MLLCQLGSVAYASALQKEDRRKEKHATTLDLEPADEEHETYRLAFIRSSLGPVAHHHRTVRPASADLSQRLFAEGGRSDGQEWETRGLDKASMRRSCNAR
ncbi:hypothetical protein CORC01_00977 [Colletotrichum orchidophilum]|uniref:Uncharacterized protein n=1 Tax=Colletotrichum orchidophilum TaxID=1209926 RepID=A0A1G4BQP8_9PEZI|nr:uncharacterized protein CORC01_00977 [Colletotrichum orchidophilum]OHF03658.1 hypothetical protein CORC01_00977 [Colletotrichum orchidophilum]